MIQRISIFTFIILLFSTISVDAHESFLSVTQMKYNAETNSIQCEMKVTAHDLEKTLKIQSGKAVILDKAALQVSNNKLIAHYLQTNFSVKIDGIKTYVTYVGYEVELNDNAWIYFEIPCPINMKEIEISNLVLTETFALQQNITHITTNTNKQSFVFTKNDTHNTFTWNE
jgi:hypothetical protein